MAGHRYSQLADQWRPEASSRDKESDLVELFSASRRRVSSPPGKATENTTQNNPPHISRPVSPPQRSRETAADRESRARRRSRSSSLSRVNDLYRPDRARQYRDRSSSSSRHYRHQTSKSRNRPNDSPSRFGHNKRRRSRSHTRREFERTTATGTDTRRGGRRSPRRRSPDSYKPDRSRSPSPYGSSYRPSSRHNEHSFKPLGKDIHRYNRRPRDDSKIHEISENLEGFVTNGDFYHRHRHQRIENQPKRPSDRTLSPKRESITSSHHRRRRHESPASHIGKNRSEEGRHRHRHRHRHHSRSRSRSPRQEPPSRSKRERLESENMRSSYPHHTSRGDHRTSYPPRIDTNYGQSPPYHSSPPAQSPYGSGRGGWPGQSPYNSHPVSPYPPGPQYRQGSYPPASTPGYFTPPAPPVGYSPPYSAQYPPPQSFRGPTNHYSPPDRDRRHSGPPNSQNPAHTAPRRGHFSNLSWTPATGSRGGLQVSTSRNRPTGPNSNPSDGNDDEENPFRPSKDLRAEDLAAKESRDATSRDDATTDQIPSANNQQSTVTFSATQESKIKFAFKAKPTAVSSVLSSTVDPAQKSRDFSAPLKGKAGILISQRRQNELRMNTSQSSQRDGHIHDKPGVSRNEDSPAKPQPRRPTLPPELAASDSVYYRRPGNESVVGSGTYGKVFRAIHVYTGAKVALKKIRMEGERDGFPVTATREVKLLQSLHNENVVKLIEVMAEKNDCYMVFEYLSHDLTGLLNHPTFKLDLSHKKHLASQLFQGLDYLHRRAVLHRDIKAANILISNTGQLKLADFGLARFFVKRRQLDYTNRVITIWYRSPELLLGETKYGPAVDIWSAACVMIEIFTRHAIFPGDGGEINQLDKIYNVLGTPSQREWPAITDMAWFELLRPNARKTSTFTEKYQHLVSSEAFELLKVMFSFDPARRPSAGEILQHPYFQSEEPAPKMAFELQDLQGDWHEFESKALRKEKERTERKAREAREIEIRESKRKGADDTSTERESKKARVNDKHGDQSAVSA